MGQLGCVDRISLINHTGMEVGTSIAKNPMMQLVRLKATKTELTVKG